MNLRLVATFFRLICRRIGISEFDSAFEMMFFCDLESIISRLMLYGQVNLVYAIHLIFKIQYDQNLNEVFDHLHCILLIY